MMRTDEPQSAALRVLWVNQYAAPPSRAGGTRHWSLARHLKSRNVYATIVAASQDYLRRRNVGSHCVSTAPEDVAGVPFIWLPAPEHDGSVSRVLNMLAFAWRVSRLPREHLLGVQGVIGSTPQPFAAYAALRIARRIGVPFILEVRDIWPKSLMDIGNHSRFHPLILLFGWMERRLCASARGVITLLPGSEKYFVTRGVAENDVVAVPNGVDLSQFDTPVCTHSSKQFTVIYAGAHGTANSLDTILHAAKLLEDTGQSDVRIRLIGDGPDKPRLLRASGELELANLEFVDPIPKERIYKELARADACVICLSRAEVFGHGVSPNKLYDYFSVARPVIFAVDAGNNPVAEAQAGITVAAEDPHALADAIVRLRDAGAVERAKLGSNGRRFVEANHDFARLAERLGERLGRWLLR